MSDPIIRKEENASFVPVDEVGVGSWRDGPANSGVPPSAVVLHFSMAPELVGMGALESIEKNMDMTFGVRLKSRERVDWLIGLLQEYRDEVWP